MKDTERLRGFGEKFGRGVQELREMLGNALVSTKGVLPLCTAYGFLSASATLPFGAQPFAIALICAFDKRSLFIYAGAVLSLLPRLSDLKSSILFGIYTLALLGRVIAPLLCTQRADVRQRSCLDTLFAEPARHRVLESATLALLLGACVLILGGMTYYDLLGMLLGTALCPLACYLFIGEASKDSPPLLRRAGRLALLCTLVAGGSGYRFFGVSLALTLAVILTLWTAERQNFALALLTAAALGLICSPRLVLPLLIVGLCGSLFVRHSPTLACFLAFFSASAWSFYSMGLAALGTTFSSLMSGCLIYCALNRVSSKKPERASIRIACRVLEEQELDRVRLWGINRKMAAIGRAMEESEQADGQSTRQSERADLYMDYSSFSSLLENELEQGGEYTICEGESRRLCTLLEREGLGVSGAAIYGTRRRMLCVRCESREGLQSRRERIRECGERIMGGALELKGEIPMDGKRRAMLIFGERAELCISVGTYQLPAVGEGEWCGDSLDFGETSDRFFAVLSDGMGSGRRAARVAARCVRFVCTMEKAVGINYDVITLLNAYLRRKRDPWDEMSTTADICEVDLVRGECVIWKSGAASSYICHGGEVREIGSNNMPLGILERADAKRYRFELTERDTVVMVSDGVPEGRWLSSLLSSRIGGMPERHLARLIAQGARRRGSSDDISVMIISVKKRDEES